MPSPTRFLQSSGQLPAAEPPVPLAVDSDVVVILAALLCALICVVGLALVARCAWLRRFSSTAPPSPPPPPPPPTKGLKKKDLRSLPILSFDKSVAPAACGGNLVECPICLAEFAAGDEIRILPHCGHGFHVTCVDTWLGSNSSCPSCRQILVVPAPSRCRRCGATSVDTAAVEAGAKAGEDGGFLP